MWETLLRMGNIRFSNYISMELSCILRTSEVPFFRENSLFNCPSYIFTRLCLKFWITGW